MSEISTNMEMPTCPLSRIRKLYEKTIKLSDAEPISLELLLTACFPTVWANINQALSNVYNQGFNDGKEAARHEDKGNHG